MQFGSFVRSLTFAVPCVGSTRNRERKRGRGTRSDERR